MEILTLKDELRAYLPELETELHQILSWWMNFATDPNGGFIGRVDHDQNIYPEAVKGAVLHARILWSFSAGYNSFRNSEYLEHAHLAYNYIHDHFIDTDFGGVYWTVDALGKPLSTRKQVYAIAFVIYALAEYSRAAESEEAVKLAISLYGDLQEHSFDEQRTGYFEAFHRDWSEIADQRLSDKDANEKKTMNTHLHVLEAYTNLYRVWKDEGLKRQILTLLNNFSQYIIKKDTFHLNLFMDEDWSVKSSAISFGHDIEASWLLLEAAEVLEDAHVIDKVKDLAVKMAGASLEGLDIDGGMLYELDLEEEHVVKEKHWWVQAEAMVGFFNAWQISGDDRFMRASLGVWDYVKGFIIDPVHGEWIWGRDEQGQVMKNEDKAGLWKCPYHNSRACIELVHRLQQLKA